MLQTGKNGSKAVFVQTEDIMVIAYLHSLQVLPFEVQPAVGYFDSFTLT